MTEVPERWSLDRLLSLFELERVERDVFRAPNPQRGPWRRVFGGQVAAQALRAAQLTVDPDPPNRRPIQAERAIHSLHAYFLRPGQVGEPIELTVERPRDGRSFSTRYVAAVQGDEVIFDMIASFHAREPGPDFQAPIAGDIEPPEEVPPEQVPGGRMRSTMPFEMRSLGPQPPGPYSSTRRVWFKTTGEMPDDAALHACVLTFASDMGAVSAARYPVSQEGEDRFMSASLDHAVWFHRPIRADRWVLTDLRAISNHGARGLAMGTMHTQDGVLGLSIAQEALVRPVGGPGG